MSGRKKLAMTKQKSRDKNLQNVVKDFDKIVVNAHQAQQVQQQTNDHRHQDALNHDEH
jgi:ribosome-binding protein aMBF1 (putative translation factor)